jgi:hypothetical protein
MTGLAAGLLVFLGLWQALEWAMSERNRITWGWLVPLGLAQFAAGCLLVAWPTAVWAAVLALVVALVGLGAVLALRSDPRLSRWVRWAHVILDAAIAVALVFGLLA